MGAKGRKKMQRKKAKNRTGLLKALSGPHSSNQLRRLEEREALRNRLLEFFKK